jgi:hypothetical protein
VSAIDSPYYISLRVAEICQFKVYSLFLVNQPHIKPGQKWLDLTSFDPKMPLLAGGLISFSIFLYLSVDFLSRRLLAVCARTPSPQ